MQKRSLALTLFEQQSRFGDKLLENRTKIHSLTTESVRNSFSSSQRPAPNFFFFFFFAFRHDRPEIKSFNFASLIDKQNKHCTPTSDSIIYILWNRNSYGFDEEEACKCVWYKFFLIIIRKSEKRKHQLCVP